MCQIDLDSACDRCVKSGIARLGVAQQLCRWVGGRVLEKDQVAVERNAKYAAAMQNWKRPSLWQTTLSLSLQTQKLGWVKWVGKGGGAAGLYCFGCRTVLIHH